jgi:hypothetical protein
MPMTAEWVDRKRAEYGAAHVNDCIKRAVGGEPGLFYALEAGNVLGTPWPAGTVLEADQRFAVMMGCSFAGFIAEPVVVNEGSGA